MSIFEIAAIHSWLIVHLIIQIYFYDIQQLLGL